MRLLIACALFLALPAQGLEAIRVSQSAYFIRGEAAVPSAAAANRRNAYNTYIRMQGGDK